VSTLAITPNSCKEGTQEKHFFVLQKTAEDVVGDSLALNTRFKERCQLLAGRKGTYCVYSTVR